MAVLDCGIPPWLSVSVTEMDRASLTLVKTDVFPVPLAPKTNTLISPTGFLSSGAAVFRRAAAALSASLLGAEKSWLSARQR